MNRGFILYIFLLTSGYLFSQNNLSIINHNLTVEINPKNSKLSVTDTLSLSSNFPVQFWLNSNLVPISLTKSVYLKRIKANIKATDIGMDRDDNGMENMPDLNLWEISGKTTSSLIISYKGFINDSLSQSKGNYQRGFSQTSGIISHKGIYLAGSSYWVPSFENSLTTFKLTVILPKDWKSVAIGDRIQIENKQNKHIDTWICNKPEEEIFLIAAKFHEYSYDMNNGVKAMAFLRTPDEGLANKYLEVTEQYMNMYNEMLGDYPYSKFALVENFWETGYGMPSFTLLGEKIIRFPFILHSSYPHELLHNWWGNSVFVDFKEGNWCEGTTAFMADHLIKEQREQGEEYRRNTLQKFTNLVNESNDFPLNKFIGRYDGPSEAIGYGKALMMWQMLRRKLGDETFLKGMQLFYKENKFNKASYTDIRQAMEAVSNMDLTEFFYQWITRIGAPEITIKSVRTDRYGGKYRLYITLQQLQDQKAFFVDIPIMIATEKSIKSFVVNMSKKEQEFQLIIDDKPLKLAVDPQYDVFRLLSPKEVPPTLSKIWGSEENIIILPVKDPNLNIYQTFANQWVATDNDEFEIVMDKDITVLPRNKTVWILGFENKFAKNINEELIKNHSLIKQDSVIFLGKKNVKKDNSFIFTLFDKDNIKTIKDLNSKKKEDVSEVFDKTIAKIEKK
ncbi:MAG TPA: hypothetical protein EYP69_01230, partial [Bacteroidales bacterium]|nr:hypothetical protein [Bacteroidales bacterium]